MRGEIQRPGNIAPGRERYRSGLRDRSADLERDCTLTQYSRAEHAMAYQFGGRPGRATGRGCGSASSSSPNSSARSYRAREANRASHKPAVDVGTDHHCQAGPAPAAARRSRPSSARPLAVPAPRRSQQPLTGGAKAGTGLQHMRPAQPPGQIPPEAACRPARRTWPPAAAGLAPRSQLRAARADQKPGSEPGPDRLQRTLYRHHRGATCGTAHAALPSPATDPGRPFLSRHGHGGAAHKTATRHTAQLISRRRRQ